MDKNAMLLSLNNLLLVFLVLFILYYSIVLLIERRKREQLLSLHKKRKKNLVQKAGEKFKSLRTLYDEIDAFMVKRGKEHVSDLVFYGIITLSVIVSLAMMFAGQFILAIIYPAVFIWFVRKILTISKKSVVTEMEEELPSTIDNMIRVFSKYADIKTIIYETSEGSSGPLKKELEVLSRQMTTKNPMFVLEEFSEKYNSVWLNNFGFTLMGYLQDSSKNETIENLRHLRKILEQEHKTKKEAISQRRPSLMINYALAVIGVVAAFLNILINPQGFDFFFHTYLGLFSFTAGFASVLGTIYMNIKMMKVDD